MTPSTTFDNISSCYSLCHTVLVMVDAELAKPDSTLTERSLRVVEAVVNAGEPVGPRGLARVLGLDRSTVGRILARLEQMGMLERVSKGYVPGWRLFTLARVLTAIDPVSNDVVSVLERLVHRYDETCYLCTFSGGVAAFTHEVQSTKPLRFVAELGHPVPLHAGAGGRAILAGLDPQMAAELLGKGRLPTWGPNTMTDPAELLDLASRDRIRGYSVSFEERVPGGGAVAAPFFDRRQRCLGSVVFSAPLSRLDHAIIPEIGEAVVEVAETLSH
ncbi:MAG: helix-turn-helix domain-containing protein [Acidimicrobiia bacterium]|nr:helix-turn-helix domain-containing protein [Acidimicrobiia bacterium]